MLSGRPATSVPSELRAIAQAMARQTGAVNSPHTLALAACAPRLFLDIFCATVVSSGYFYCASCARRNPSAPERSMLGEIISSLPCSVSLYACGKYQTEPRGW